MRSDIGEDTVSRQPQRRGGRRLLKVVALMVLLFVAAGAVISIDGDEENAEVSQATWASDKSVGDEVRFVVRGALETVLPEDFELLEDPHEEVVSCTFVVEDGE